MLMRFVLFCIRLFQLPAKFTRWFTKSLHSEPALQQTRGPGEKKIIYCMLISSHSFLPCFILSRSQPQLPPEMANMTKLKVLDLRSNEGSGFIFPPGSIGAQRGLTSTWKAEAPKVLELFELAQPDEEQDVIETTTVPMPQELKSEISWLLGRLKPANANVNTSPQAGDEAEEVLPSLVMVPPDSPRMRRPVSPERQQYGDPRRAATSPTTVNRSWALRERYMPQ